MPSKLGNFFQHMIKEPPFRLVAAAIIKRFTKNLRTQALWDISVRPNYLTGLLYGADQAKREGVEAISVLEFGVAGGRGLLALQDIAEAVEAETGVEIFVYGFDRGHFQGLPKTFGDYRDHPDQWQGGDFPMDEEKLRKRLNERTTLIIGDVAETVPTFVQATQKYPVGFMAIDLDLYTATTHALKVLSHPNRNILYHVPMYFDDMEFFYSHKYAGEILAINEFNDSCPDVKIDQWRGLAGGRPFHERTWLKVMYVAHNLQAISKWDKNQQANPRVIPI